MKDKFKLKVLFISLLVILLLSIILFIYFNSNDEVINKVYLSSEYYGGNEYLEIDNLDGLEDKTYLLFTYNNYCNMKVSCDTIFDKFMKNEDITILSMPFEKFKETTLHDTILFAPSVVLVKNGEIITYLDANKDEDYDRYQDVNEFTKWISKYIYLDK